MEDVTRRTAMGLAAVGAVALAASGTAEAVTSIKSIPKSFGRVVAGGRGETEFSILFEAEDGTLTVVNIVYGIGGGIRVLGEYKRT